MIHSVTCIVCLHLGSLNVNIIVVETEDVTKHDLLLVYIGEKTEDKNRLKSSTQLPVMVWDPNEIQGTGLTLSLTPKDKIENVHMYQTCDANTSLFTFDVSVKIEQVSPK